MKTIEYIGDLLLELREGRVNAICHVCNDQGVMGSGIALQIKEAYPDAYQAYVQAYENWRTINFRSDIIVRDNKNFLGNVSYANFEIVYNMVAQSMYGQGIRHLNYEALYACLEQVRDDLLRRGVKTLGIPKYMGALRAGGDWNVVEAMINSVFEKTDIQPVIVEYYKGKV